MSDDTEDLSDLPAVFFKPLENAVSIESTCSLVQDCTAHTKDCSPILEDEPDPLVQELESFLSPFKENVTTTNVRMLHPEAKVLFASMVASLTQPPQLLQDFLAAAETLNPSALDALACDMLDRMEEMILSEYNMTEKQVIGIGLWLCAAYTCSLPQMSQLRVAHVLRTILKEQCNSDQAITLSEKCLKALPNSVNRLDLYNAVLGTSEAAVHFTDTLLKAALTDTLKLKESVNADNIVEMLKMKWHTLDLENKLVVMQMLELALSHIWSHDEKLKHMVVETLQRLISYDSKELGYFKVRKICMEVSKMRYLFLPDEDKECYTYKEEYYDC